MNIHPTNEELRSGLLMAKIERVRDYGRRGDWDGLREYVLLNLLADEAVGQDAARALMSNE